MPIQTDYEKEKKERCSLLFFVNYPTGIYKEILENSKILLQLNSSSIFKL